MTMTLVRPVVIDGIGDRSDRDPLAVRWLGMCGVEPDGDVVPLVCDLLADGVNPHDGDGRRLLLEVEFPDVWWDGDPPALIDEHGLMELRDRWKVCAYSHAEMLEQVAYQLFGRDLFGLRAVAHALADVGMTRFEVLTTLAILLDRHLHDDTFDERSADLRALADELDGLVVDTVDGGADCGDFGMTLLERAVDAGDDERVRRIVEIKLARDEDGDLETCLLADLSRYYEKAGLLESALSAAQRSALAKCRCDDDRRLAGLRIAELEVKLGRNADANERFETARASAPDDLWTFHIAAAAYRDVGDVDQALCWVEAGLDIARDREQLGFGMAFVATSLLETRARLTDSAPDAQVLARVQAHADRDDARTRARIANGSLWRAGQHRSHEPRSAPASPGRNEPCPCDSGKKYKRCCLTRSAI